MNVALIFDAEFKGPVAEAVWIIESPSNHRWFENVSAEIEPNSAIFNSDVTVLSVIWNAQEHHPTWTFLNVIGLALTAELATTLAREGTIRPTELGFEIQRV